MRRVVATAGHVDHGKSTLVRALTGRDPDRLEEEHRRGLTIELGFAWAHLDAAGEELDVAFVDVPGHRRFVGTMLTGLGPAPAVLLVVAADQGWQEQTSEHVAAMRALGIEHVLLVVTRTDLADPGPVLTTSLARLAEQGWHDVTSCTVSATTGEGMTRLRELLAGFVTALPAPQDDAPVRLWVDRAFTIRGAGTVVTGTLGAGRMSVGDGLIALAPDGQEREVVVRGLQSEDAARERVSGVSRTAVNLRQVDVDDVGRGSVLLTPGAWELASVVDVRLVPSERNEPVDLPELTVHVGTADLPGRVRPLGPDHARVQTAPKLPWRVGDRLLLRDPGSRRVWGAVAVDVGPLPLRRRGAATARGQALRGGDLRAVRLAERGVQRAEQLERIGLGARESTDTGRSREVGIGPLVIDRDRFQSWVRAAAALVEGRHATDPLAAGMPVAELEQALGLPAEVRTAALVAAIADAAGLELVEGVVRRPGRNDLGAAEAAIAELSSRLAGSPFAAPEADELTALGLGGRELAAAAHRGRLLRLPGDVVLLPDAPARAMRVLTGLEQPFTLSEARQALGTTRRVAVPLLEHLDERGWTRRVDSGRREIRR